MPIAKEPSRKLAAACAELIANAGGDLVNGRRILDTACIARFQVAIGMMFPMSFYFQAA
jgi:hypothetical protein